MRDVATVRNGTMTVVSVDAPDSAKSIEEYEKFVQMLKRVLSEGRKEGARLFF